MIINYEDYLLEELLNESMVNEKINLEKINNVIKKIGDKTNLVYKLIKKFNETENLLAKKHLATILILVFFGSLIMKHGIYPEASATSVEKAAIELAKEYNHDLTDVKKIKAIVSPIIFPVDSSTLQLKKIPLELIPAVDINTAKTSYNTKEFIKDHEKLRLEAYDLGDGHITVGYGHATPAKRSPYKIGDKITEKEANKLFVKDIENAEDGVKRMLKDWKKHNIDVKITQSMFDSMVSMAFNMGIYGFVKADFLNDLKNKDYKAAAEKIKTTRITAMIKDENGDYVKVQMPGLVDRRLTEYKLFTKDLT